MLSKYLLFPLEEGSNPTALENEEEVARRVQGGRPGKFVVNATWQTWKGVYKFNGVYY